MMYIRRPMNLSQLMVPHSHHGLQHCLKLPTIAAHRRSDRLNLHPRPHHTSPMVLISLSMTLVNGTNELLRCNIRLRLLLWGHGIPGICIDLRIIRLYGSRVLASSMFDTRKRKGIRQPIELYHRLPAEGPLSRVRLITDRRPTKHPDQFKVSLK